MPTQAFTQLNQAESHYTHDGNSRKQSLRAVQLEAFRSQPCLDRLMIFLNYPACGVVQRACAKSTTLVSHNRIHSSLSVMSGEATSQTRTAVHGMGGWPLRPYPGRQGALNVTAVALTHKCAVRAGCVGLWRNSTVNSPKGTALRAAANKRPARFPVSGWLNARSFAARITKPWPSS